MDVPLPVTKVNNSFVYMKSEKNIKECSKQLFCFFEVITIATFSAVEFETSLLLMDISRHDIWIFDYI